MNQKTIGFVVLGIALVASGLIWNSTQNRTAGLANIGAVVRGPQTDPGAIEAQVKAGIATLIDVRTDEEWAAGHAASATHFDVTRLQGGETIPLAKDSLIYLYCHSGRRAGIAKSILEQNGYTNVVNLGGLSDWQAKGGPVES